MGENHAGLEKEKVKATANELLGPRLKPEEIERMRAEWERAHSGPQPPLRLIPVPNNGDIMRTEWTALLIAAGTDFVITFATALVAVMTVPGGAELPTKASIIVAALGGAVAAAQTIRQALKATPESVNSLKAMINKAPQPHHEDQ